MTGLIEQRHRAHDARRTRRCRSGSVGWVATTGSHARSPTERGVGLDARSCRTRAVATGTKGGVDEAVGSSVGRRGGMRRRGRWHRRRWGAAVGPDAERRRGSIVGPAACGTQARTHAPMSRPSRRSSASASSRQHLGDRATEVGSRATPRRSRSGDGGPGTPSLADDRLDTGRPGRSSSTGRSGGAADRWASSSRRRWRHPNAARLRRRACLDGVAVSGEAGRDVVVDRGVSTRMATVPGMRSIAGREPRPAARLAVAVVDRREPLVRRDDRQVRSISRSRLTTRPRHVSHSVYSRPM